MYLSETEKLGTAFTANKKESFQGYSDAVRNSEQPTCRSITGTVLACSCGTIYWKCKQQSTAAESSKENEFVALSFCVRDLWRLQNFKRYLNGSCM